MIAVSRLISTPKERAIKLALHDQRRQRNQITDRKPEHGAGRDQDKHLVAKIDDDRSASAWLDKRKRRREPLIEPVDHCGKQHAPDHRHGCQTSRSLPSRWHGRSRDQGTRSGERRSRPAQTAPARRRWTPTGSRCRAKRARGFERMTMARRRLKRACLAARSGGGPTKINDHRDHQHDHDGRSRRSSRRKIQTGRSRSPTTERRRRRRNSRHSSEADRHAPLLIEPEPKRRADHRKAGARPAERQQDVSAR